MTRRLACFTACALTLLSGFARAQDPEPRAPALGQAGRVAVSAERLFGFVFSSSTLSANGVDNPTATSTGISVLSSPISGAGSYFSAPRLGVDVFVAPGLSVGGAAGGFFVNQSAAGGQTTYGIVVDPRIGYLARLSPSVALWPRLGVSVLFLDTSMGGMGVAVPEESTVLVAATLEAPFAFTLAPRVAFTLGPTLDISVYGHEAFGSDPGATESLRVIELGLQAALLVCF